MKTLEDLLNTMPQVGRVCWIGLRPERRAAMVSVERVNASCESGLQGDRYQGRSGKRQVSLIQQEHLPVIASCCGLSQVAPQALRRNIVVSGINLLALKNRIIRIGQVRLQITGLCHPCSRMEETLGPGGYNAVRGHGGINARVLTNGEIRVGDEVMMVQM